jgi:hypothetical protein
MRSKLFVLTVLRCEPRLLPPAFRRAPSAGFVAIKDYPPKWQTDRLHCPLNPLEQ